MLTNFEWNLSGFGLGRPNTQLQTGENLVSPHFEGFSEGLCGPGSHQGDLLEERCLIKTNMNAEVSKTRLCRHFADMKSPPRRQCLGQLRDGNYQ